MNLRKLSILFAFLFIIGCGQSDSNNNSDSDETATTEQNQAESGTENADASAESERVGKVLARVNGTPIYEDDLNGKDLDFIITEEVIYQAGLKQGIDKQYEDQVRDYERMLVIKGTKEKMLENMGPTKDISDEEIERYYELNKDKYSHVRIYEISFPDVNMGEEIKEKVSHGEDLQEIAVSYTDIPVNVADLGYNRKLAQQFKDKEVGAVSEVIQKENGTFAVMKIVEIKEIPFSASKNSIRHILEARRKGEMYENNANRLAEENGITIERVGQEQNPNQRPQN